MCQDSVVFHIWNHSHTRSLLILGLDLNAFAAHFIEVHDTPFLLVRADASESAKWATLLGVPARRCYISDTNLKDRSDELGVAGSEIAAVKIPDPGPVMSGDFGEILAAFYLAAAALPEYSIDPVKWRYKADRKKAAPHADIVQFIVPKWPDSSAHDSVTCAEVKAKATGTNFDPIAAAVEGSGLDRAGRLVNTLNWLKEKAISDGSDTVNIAQLDRFISAIDHPALTRNFLAVAIIDSNYVESVLELGTVPNPSECTLVVISVPELKKRYTELFHEIVVSAAAFAPPATTAPRAVRSFTSDA